MHRLVSFLLASSTLLVLPAPRALAQEPSPVALRLSFQASLAGPCMRCLKEAAPLVGVEAREVDRPGEGEELESPYVREELLDLAAWAHDVFVLTAPVKVLCREDCAGLCPICAADLNEAGPEHAQVGR